MSSSVFKVPSPIPDRKMSASPASIFDGNVDLTNDEIIALFDPVESMKDKGYAKMMGNDVENKFLTADSITTSQLTEADLTTLFGSHKINEEQSSVVDYLKNTLLPVVNHSVHCGAPTMIGHMTSSLPYYIRPLSKLVTTLHANNVKVETGKASTFLEKETLAMLHNVFYKFDDAFYEQWKARNDACLGVICSGGTIANSTAMWIARNKCLPADGDKFRGVEKQGLAAGLIHYGYKSACIIGSAVMHYSMLKSADILGIGCEGLKKIPFDENYRINIDELRKTLVECREEKIAVLSIVGVAGGTETGSVDDLSAIADLAEEFNVHFHVDGAWGGPVIFSEYGQEILRGIDRADTITIDGHKQLYTPMGCGLCLLKDPSSISAVEKTANYIIRKQSSDLGKFSMEGSRPAVSMFLHANLRILGVSGLSFLMERSISLTRHLTAALKDASGQFEMVLDPMTNILLYRYLPVKLNCRDDVNAGKKLSAEQLKTIDEANIALQNHQKAKGKTFCSRTTIFSHAHDAHVVAIRVVIANPLTECIHLDEVIADQLEIARQLGLDSA